MAYAKGKKPAVHTMHTMRSALVMQKHLSALGPPPTASNDYVAAVNAATGGDWGMMGNDAVGDCTCADDGHKLMLRSANSASKIVIPTADQILAQYTAITGYDGTPGDQTDEGADELTVCQYMKANGLLGSKSDDFASLDPNNFDFLKWGIQLFGAVRIGINLPNSAEDQFSADQPWAPVAGSAIEGGHDVPLVHYDSQYFYCVTWGKLQPVVPAFLPAYCDEAHLELFYDWIKEQGTAPSGLDLNQLDSDLKNLGAPS